MPSAHRLPTGSRAIALADAAEPATAGFPASTMERSPKRIDSVAAVCVPGTGCPRLSPSLGFRHAAGVVSIHATGSVVLRGDLPCVPYATEAWRAFVESMARRDHPATFSRRIAAPRVEPAWTAIHTLAGGRRACRR